MQKPTDLYLVSSTLHFFWAWLLAFKNKPHRNAHLWLIDQYSDKPMAFVPFIDQVESPFVDWKLFDGREKGGLEKLKLRRKLFGEVRTWAKGHLIERVFIGNDRSVFGQYTIKTLKQNSQKNGQHCTACFLDDGVFTYLGRAASQSWSEKYLDALAKKLMFGFWYDSPATVGASKWIDEAWMMYPNEANGLLNNKSRHDFGLTRDDLSAFQPIAELLIKQHAPDLLTTKAPDVLIALPNYYLIKATPDYPVRLAQLITNLQQQGLRIAVKYHPAAQGKDLLNLAEKFGVQCLNDQLSFEVLLAYWQDQSVGFIGDLSTTTLLAHYFGFSSQWLPGVQSTQTQAMQVFCKKLDITEVVIHD
jgi:hypothetical protein